MLRNIQRGKFTGEKDVKADMLLGSGGWGPERRGRDEGGFGEGKAPPLEIAFS